MVKQLILHPYGFPLYFCTTVTEARDVSDSLHDFGKYSAMACEADDDVFSSRYVIYSPGYWGDVVPESKSQYIATLAHETEHIVDFLMERIGETRPGIEQRSYLIEYILKWLIDESGVMLSYSEWGKERKRRLESEVKDE